MTFQEFGKLNKVRVLHINKKNIQAFGIYMPDAVLEFPDTGVFILFSGSDTCCEEHKYQKYIENGKTTKEIVFGSRNKAAQFVLGEGIGTTDDWK